MSDTPPARRPAADDSTAAQDRPEPGSGPSLGARELRAMAAGTLIERMGLELLEAAPERCVGSMPVAGNTQPYGLLHGGASVVLAETLGSVAAMLAAGPGRYAVGVDVSATHHRATREGVVTGVATAVHVGRTTACYEIVITDERDRRVCTSRLTCALRDAEPA